MERERWRLRVREGGEIIMKYESILFVGGQEDGKYLTIYEGAEVWQVYDESEPRLTYKHGEEPAKHEVRVLEYVRRGNAMHLNS